MALTLDATAMTTLSTADTLTNWTGPTTALDPDKLKEGTNSISSIVRNTGQQEYYSPATTDFTGEHLRLWVTSDVSSAMPLTGLTGLRFYVASGNNTSYWNIADGSTYSGGWLNICVDADNPDTPGATITAITEVGIEFTLTSSYKRVINTWVDYLRYGEGYIAYGTNWNFDDIAVSDAAGGYGVNVPYEDVNFITGNIQIGRATEQTTFSETGSLISFTGAPVASTLYGLSIVGQASSTFSFLGCVITTAGQPFYLDFDDTGIADFTFNGNTVQGASTSHFRALSTASEVLSNTFDGCGVIYPQGSKFENNIITNTSVTGTDGSLYITDSATATAMKDISFSNYTGKYAIHIPASVTGSITLDGCQFDGSGTDIYWAGTAGTLTVNAVNGANVSTSSSAGGTVSIVNSVTVKIIVKDATTQLPIQGARILLEKTSDGTDIISGISDVNGEISLSYNFLGDTGVIGRARKSSATPYYKTGIITGTITSAGFITTILLIKDE